MMPERKNIAGIKIREARLSEKPAATQQDISARLAILGIFLTDSSIGKIENGTRSVTDIQLIGFAKALKVTVAYLLDE